MLERADSVMFVAIEWIQSHCVVPDRFQAGAPFVLYDYQLSYLSDFYTVKGSAEWIPSDPLLSSAFVYRRGLLVKSQKTGKGPMTAAHICLESVGPALFAGWAEPGDVYDCRDHGCGCGWTYAYDPGEPMGMPWPTPLIQVTAMSQDQVRNIYDALKPMVQMGPLTHLIPDPGVETMHLPGGGRIDVVSSSAKSRLGQRVTFVPQDEVGLWTKSNKMADVASTQYRGLAGMGGRASLTTNAWDPAEGSVAQREYESSDASILRHFRQAPSSWSYGNKVERRRIHRFAYGDTLREHGGHVDLDTIEAEADKLAEEDPAEAERFFGNRLVQGKGSYVEESTWDECDAEGRVVPDGCTVVGGFDGSESDDWSAIRLKTFDGHAFTPRYGPDRRLAIWNPEEFGGEIPRREVDSAWREICGTYNVLRVYCDPFGWRTEIAEWGLEFGDKVFLEWTTGRITQVWMALKSFLRDLTSGKVTHDGCVITRRHALNARKSARGGQMYILQKASQVQKIDALMSDVLAHEAWIDCTASGDFVKAAARSVKRKMIVG